MRRLAFFGSENSSVPGLSSSRRIRYSCRDARNVPASRFMSDHRKPNASPIRKPDRQGDDVKRFQRVLFGRIEERARLVRVERRCLLLTHLLRVDARRVKTGQPAE